MINYRLETPYKFRRYFVFGYDDYYATGGMNDFMGSFDAIEDAIEFLKTHFDEDNLEIWDMDKGVKIEWEW